MDDIVSRLLDGAVPGSYGEALRSEAAAEIERLRANQERWWCKACGTVTRDRQCDCTKFSDQDTQSLVNYADAMQAAAHEEAQENELLRAALKEAKELIDEGESGYITGTGGDTDWNTRAAAFLRAYEQNVKETKP